MSRGRRKLGLFEDVLASGFLSGLGAVANLLSVFLFARALNPTDFGLLSTCRRVVAFLAPLAGLSGHLAVSRYLGYWTSDARRRSAVFVVGSMLLVATVPVTAGIFFLLRSAGSSVAWLAAVDSTVWNATAVFTCATGVGLLTFSILRGLGHPHAANLHQLLYLTALLGIAAIASGRRVDQLLYAASAAGLVVSIAHILWVVRLHRREWRLPDLATLRASGVEVVRYGLPRLADGPSQASLPLIGVLLAPGIGGLALAGQLHIGQTVVRMLEVMIVPLSVIFLPLVARQVREGKRVALERQAQLVFDAVLLLSLYLCIQSLAWAGPLLRAAFGDKYAGAEPLLIATLPAIVPHLLYAGFRSFIDGYSERPVNFLNLLVANGVVIGVSIPLAAQLEGVGLALGYVAGVCVLGLLTVRFAHSHLNVHVVTRVSGFSLAAAPGLGLLSWVMARVVESRGPMTILVAFVIAQGVTALLLLGLAMRWQHPAITYALARLRRGGSAGLQEINTGREPVRAETSVEAAQGDLAARAYSHSGVDR